MVRTALFNWAYARHTGGKLVFRIEDPDAARDSEESYQAIIDTDLAPRLREYWYDQPAVLEDALRELRA